MHYRCKKIASDSNVLHIRALSKQVYTQRQETAEIHRLLNILLGILDLAMQLQNKAQGSHTTDVMTLGNESIPLGSYYFYYYL